MQQPNSSTDDQCWHVIRWVNSTRSVPALKRCFRSRSTANTIRRRGIVGDRSSDHLDPHDPEQNPLGVIQCDPSRCDCMRWPSGHNAASIPEKPQRRLLVCEFCHKARRNAVELVDLGLRNRRSSAHDAPSGGLSLWRSGIVSPWCAASMPMMGGWCSSRSGVEVNTIGFTHTIV